MPAATTTVERYRQSVSALTTALQAVGPVVSADDEIDDTVAADDELDRTIDEYVAASAQLFDETVVDDDARTAVASLGGDLRVLAELGSLESGPQLVAGDDGTVGAFGDDMALVVAVASDEAPTVAPIVVADEDAVASAIASIDGMSAEGRQKLADVLASAVMPSAADLSGAVARLFGGAAGEAVKGALDALRGLVARIARALTKLLGAVLDKVAKLLGQGARSKVEEWLKELITPTRVYEHVLGVGDVRDRARATLGAAPDAGARAARIAAVAGSHGDDQRWIGWGSKGLGWARGSKLATVAPWGPIVLGLAAVALVTACAWLTQDHLDSTPLDWLPDRVRGVGAALS